MCRSFCTLCSSSRAPMPKKRSLSLPVPSRDCGSNSVLSSGERRGPGRGKLIQVPKALSGPRKGLRQRTVNIFYSVYSFCIQQLEDLGAQVYRPSSFAIRSRSEPPKLTERWWLLVYYYLSGSCSPLWGLPRLFWGNELPNRRGRF